MDEEREPVDCLEKVVAEEVAEEVAEKDRSSLGHADRAGVGEIEGDGEESLVKGGELLPVVEVGLRVILNS